MKTQTCENCGHNKGEHKISGECLYILVFGKMWLYCPCEAFKPSHNHSQQTKEVKLVKSKESLGQSGRSSIHKTAGTHSSDVRITDFNKDMIEDERRYYGETYDETR